MSSTTGLFPEVLMRLPGLYRRWELTEVFEPNRNYQIEDAGAHADGTPLLAVYVSDPVCGVLVPPPNSAAPQNPKQRKAS